MERDPFMLKSRKVSVQRAYEDLIYVFRHVDHPDHLLKDSELCDKYGVSRSTMREIRMRLGVPVRADRIANLLSMMDTKNMYLNEIAEKLNGRVHYKCLHKAVERDNIPIKKRSQND